MAQTYLFDEPGACQDCKGPVQRQVLRIAIEQEPGFIDRTTGYICKQRCGWEDHDPPPLAPKAP